MKPGPYLNYVRDRWTFTTFDVSLSFTEDKDGYLRPIVNELSDLPEFVCLYLALGDMTGNISLAPMVSKEIRWLVRDFFDPKTGELNSKGERLIFEDRRAEQLASDYRFIVRPEKRVFPSEAEFKKLPSTPCKEPITCFLVERYFSLSRIGLHVRPGFTDADLAKCEEFCKRGDSGIQYTIGDLLLMYGTRYGETYDIPVKVFGKDKGTLKQIKMVCSRLEKSERPHDLSFSVVAAIVLRGGYPKKCQTAKQRKAREDWMAETRNWFRRAAEEAMGVRSVKEAIKAALASTRGGESQNPRVNRTLSQLRNVDVRSLEPDAKGALRAICERLLKLLSMEEVPNPASTAPQVMETMEEETASTNADTGLNEPSIQAMSY